MNIYNRCIKYHTVEDFLELMKYHDLIYVKIGHEVYLELKSLRIVLEITTLFPTKNKSKIIINRNEYDKEVLDKTEDLLIQQKIKECIRDKNYFSVEDFENEIDKRKIYIEIEDNVFINLHHYGTYNLKDIFHYGNQGYLIFQNQYNKDVLDAYFLMKKIQKI